MKATIVCLPGDGIGPEVVGEARRALEEIGRRGEHDFTFTDHLIGGIAIDKQGTPLSDETVQACKNSDAVLLGAVGSAQQYHGSERCGIGAPRFRCSRSGALASRASWAMRHMRSNIWRRD
jgi:3-isopropylmalate dehydrogenase